MWCSETDGCTRLYEVLLQENSLAPKYVFCERSQLLGANFSQKTTFPKPDSAA